MIRKGRMRFLFRTGILSLFIVLAVAYNFLYGGDAPLAASVLSDLTPTGPSRQLLNVSTNAAFPKALASGRQWMMAVYIPLIMYMFLALAIICDEFFVPALEIICDEEHLDLSDDVAGATFMAAGGSAPELFTSFIGTFQESAVGFGTIVGSAVFNVLFVIAMCAFFSKELLTLTWWPLARDSTYYTFSLIMLAVFFGFVTPDEIHLWEALVLFSMYGGYICLMINNEALYQWLGFSADPVEKCGPDGTPLAVDLGRDGKPVRVHRAHLHKFRHGILGMVQRASTLSSEVGDHLVSASGNLTSGLSIYDNLDSTPLSAHQATSRVGEP